MDANGSMCPLLEKTCIEERCAWYQVTGQCSITALARAFSKKGSIMD